MSANTTRVYRFATAAQWGRCITHRFDALRNGSLAPAERLGSYAVHVEGTAAPAGAPPVAVDPHGEPFWLTDASGPLGQSPRLVVDRNWVWAFANGGTIVRRVDRESLQPDLSIDVELEIRDIASDTREGIWVLAGAESVGAGDVLLHFDCEGRPRERHPVPCEAGGALQMGSVNRGGQLALLVADRKRLALVDAASGRTLRVRSIGQLAPCWTATQLATDTRNRIALWGPQEGPDPGWVLFVLDSSGDTVEGPIGDVFNTPAAGQRPKSLDSIRIAVHRQKVWFSTDAGLWRLDPSEAAGARESESTLLTPALLSPDSESDRGWLRAEAFIDLPQGGALEAQVATTDNANIAAEAERIAADLSLTSEQKQEAIWALFDPIETRRYTIPGPGTAGAPIAIPLLEPTDRWLWLRISVITPPGVKPPPLKELRVLYPNLSITQFLPAAFRGDQNDPTGALRSIAGVLESTTQRFDEIIRSIGSFMDPRTTRVEWLDYLGRWLDLPWDDELPVDPKRQLLQRAGDILDRRGTRAGLMTLLRCLLGPDARIEIVDTTVDHPPVRIGGGGHGCATLPALLAGASVRTPTLGVKAVLGRARLCGDGDPLGSIAPTLRIGIVARRDTHWAPEKLLRGVLLQYIPAGVALSIRWRIAVLGDPDTIGADGIVLDANGPGALGRDSAIGRTVVGGRGGGRLDETGLEIGFRLR